MLRIYTLILLITVSVCAQNEIETSEISLQQFIDHVAKKTGKTILYDSSVATRKLNIANLKASTNDELLNVLHSALEFNGYIVEKVGQGKSEVLKLKRNIQGPWTSTSIIYSKEELEAVANTDRFITMVIDLKHVSSREVQTTLRALRIVNPQGGNLGGIEGSNTLLITDYAPNVKRVYSVVESMDRKKNIELMTEQFAIENKTIPVKLSDKTDYNLAIEVNKNVSVVIKDENDNVLVNGNGSHTRLWLGYHMKNSISKKFQVELEVLKEDIAEINVQIHDAQDSKNAVWSFFTVHALAKGKKIKFSLLLSTK